MTSPPEGIGQEQTRLMYALLKCLRYFLGQGALALQPTLWYAEGRRYRGLGFEHTLPRAGYAWFLPIIDWARFEFIEGVGAQLAIQEQDLLGVNLLTREARNGHWTIDTLLALLDREEGHPRAQEALLTLLMHTCFRRFRQDVLLLLAKDAAADPTVAREKISNDEVALCHDDVSALFADRPSLVSGNRSMIKSVPAMLDCLWGQGGAISRTHWQDKPFRSYFFKVTSVLHQRPLLRQIWEDRFQIEFLQYHWLLPYPDGNGTLVSTAKHTRKRQWWSVVWRDAVVIQAISDAQWGKGHYQAGPIPLYPATLRMTISELSAHLRLLA